MSVRFGGQSYPSLQCPVCHFELRWPACCRRPGQRIKAVACQHAHRCPAIVIDPVCLRHLTVGQALAEASSLLGAQAGGW